MTVSAQLANMTQMMTSGGKLSAAQFAHGPGFASGQPLPGMPPGYPYPQQLYPGQPMQPGAVPTEGQPDYYVRIKPYDPQRKQLRTRQFFHELGRAINGGTGQPGDIPEWVAVDAGTASALAQYKQLPEDPMSPLVLDIVTPEQRYQIDAAEAQVRAATLGLSGMAPQAVLTAMQRPGMVAPHVGQGRSVQPSVPQQPQPVQFQTPSMMAGTVEYQQAVTQLQGGQPQYQQAPQHQQPVVPDPARAGRAAALEGMQSQTVAPQLPPQYQQTQTTTTQVPGAQVSGVQVPPPPQTMPPAPPPMASERGVSEDLTGEARASRETAEAIRNATPLLQGTSGGVRR
jgi:hypothetical protein